MNLVSLQPFEDCMKQALHAAKTQERSFQENTDIHSHLSSAPHTDRDRTEVEPGDRRSHKSPGDCSQEKLGKELKDVGKKRTHRSWTHTGNCIVCTKWGKELESCSLCFCYCHSLHQPQAALQKRPAALSASFPGLQQHLLEVLKAWGQK